MVGKEFLVFGGKRNYNHHMPSHLMEEVCILNEQVKVFPLGTYTVRNF